MANCRYHRFHRRRLEWLIALMTVYLGAVALMPAPSMSLPASSGLLDLAPEAVWGALFIAVGVVHCAALRVAARARWSPFVRAGALFANFNVFFAVGLALLLQNPLNPGAHLYLFLSFGFCGVALHSTAIECARELAAYRWDRQQRARGDE